MANSYILNIERYIILYALIDLNKDTYMKRFH